MDMKSLRGRRVLSTVIDDCARKTPEKVVASIPVEDADLTKGLKNITYKQFAKAIDAACWWLESALGSSKKLDTFAYYGERDLRYPILIVAATKVRKRILCASLFASLDAHVYLATQLDCIAFLHSKGYEDLSQSIQVNLPGTKSVRVPSLDDWLTGTELVPHYPFDKGLADIEDDPVFVVHTSGTTGRPKIVVYTHAHISTIDCLLDIPAVDGVPTYFPELLKDGRRFHSSLPIFHAAGIVFTLLFPCLFGIVAVHGPADGTPSPATTEAILHYSKPHGIFLPPVLAEAMIEIPSALAALKALEYVCYTGAPLSPTAGNLLSKVTKLRSLIGSTEASAYPTLMLEPVDWEYHRFHPDMGASLEPVDDLNLYELVIRKVPDWERMSNLFRTFPGIQEYRTKDLWAPHPTKPGLWKPSGRTDDLIWLTGEIKLYSHGIEEAVRKHPSIKDALVGGHGRIKPFMLIELNQPTASCDKELLQDVWSHVDAVNSGNSASARIEQDMIVFVATPFLTTPKGSINRLATFRSAEDRVNELYPPPNSLPN
jgi:acyl-coenzyme A synthetase/AMP-(fatty) acid ligase